MTTGLTCFKCWKNTATLTYEENRIYKVSCPCGCSYDFEHSSFKCAEEYHNKMLELYGEIDRSAKLKAENEQLKARSEAMDRAIRAFECSTGIFSFACFCCIYKDENNAHRCELLGDEVCEDLENWEFGELRFDDAEAVLERGAEG